MTPRERVIRTLKFCYVRATMTFFLIEAGHKGFCIDILVLRDASS